MHSRRGNRRTMLFGTGTTHTRVGSQAAFTYLADPRHAPDWFAHIKVTDLEPGPLRAGQTWRFEQDRSKGTRSTPSTRSIRMAMYQPPQRFVWETTRPHAGTNLVWELNCEPAAAGGSTLLMTVRWRPGLLGWISVLAASIVMPGVLSDRAQRTVERAREAVEAAFPTAAGRISGARDSLAPLRSGAKRRRRR